MRLFETTWDVIQALPLSVLVERARRREGPRQLLLRLRRRGMASRRRGPAARVRLQRIVALLDRCFPGGPNCYRRVLLEVAMDAGAAQEPVAFALRAGGGPGTGHASLGGLDSHPSGYDVIFEL